MKTVDFHTHLLSKEVSFEGIFNKTAVKLFGKKLGANHNELLNEKYEGYIKTLIRNIKESNHLYGAVVLPVDAIVSNRGVEIQRDKTVCSNNEDIYELYTRFPNQVIPFFSINPNRPDALDLIDKYVSFGFKGAKFLQNYWNIDINDKRYIPYFEKIKSYDLPIIIHTGSEYAVKSNKMYEKIDVSNLAIEVGCKVVLAHFGVNMMMEHRLSKIINNFSFDSLKFGDDYFKTIEYLEKNENVYADLSAIILFFRAKVVEDLALNQKHIHHKLLFGTDYPVPFSLIFSYHSLSLKKRCELERIQNPFDRNISFFNQYFEKDSIIYSNWKKLIKD